ncbi:hypothetical protein NDA01_14455 [Trichocoleus desertorum AS-A10]|uniref:hypothetical protein n=1 Tax=Trichocoleus desertorum TaxID=1481672 RepID=UPI00329A176D
MINSSQLLSEITEKILWLAQKKQDARVLVRFFLREITKARLAELRVTANFGLINRPDLAKRVVFHRGAGLEQILIFYKPKITS